MTELYIKFSNIVEIPVFPPDIRKIQLYQTGIVLNEEEMNEIRTMYPKATITISSVPTMKRQVPDYKLYKYTQPIHITWDSDDDDDDYSQYSYRGDSDDDDDEEQHVLDNSQTVHLSSINKSVSQSIDVICKEYEKYPQVLTPVQLLFQEQNQQDAEIVELKDAIQEWREHPAKVFGLTFGSLFTMIMTIVGGQPEEEKQRNMKQRIWRNYEKQKTNVIWVLSTG